MLIYLFPHLKRLKRNDTSVAMNIFSIRIMVSKTIFSKKKKKGNQGFLEKYLLLGLGQEIHKMILKHLIMP